MAICQLFATKAKNYCHSNILLTLANTKSYLRKWNFYPSRPYLRIISLASQIDMQSMDRRPTAATKTVHSGISHLVVGLTGLIAVIATFFLATANFEYNSKILGASGIIVAYALVCIVFFYRSQNEFNSTSLESEFSREPVFSDDLQDRLLALEAANHFFGTSLKPSDMFRLISSRVHDIFPFAASALFVIGETDESGDKLIISQAGGTNAQLLQDFEMDVAKGLAGKAFASRVIEIDKNLLIERTFMPPDTLKDFCSAAAIPLIHDQDVFGVLQLYTESEITPDEYTKDVLDAIGERVAPILRSSMAFEQSLSNALTDSLTSLPNERAFFMILENQLAESQRYRDERPLTILAIDIKDFTEANSSFGHATGDRVLNFVGRLVREQLRKMDFLARSANDEFVVILPTASERIALDVVERIKTCFANNPFEISEDETIKVWLNFGWATFWKDGETAQQLLHNAQLRKQQAKSAEPVNVLGFPKEYVN